MGASPSPVRQWIGRGSLMLSLACLGSLLAGVLIETVTGQVLFETYLSAFGSYAVLFGIISCLCRERRIRRVGFCRNCGYDLRASKERCPECGSLIVL